MNIIVEKLKKSTKGFFNRPNEFSFKDLIAATFVAAFLYISWRALSDPQALEVMKSWISLIMVILTGYFGQEAVSAYFVSKNMQNQYNNQYQGYSGYQGYGYNNYNYGNGYTNITPTVVQEDKEP